MENAREAIINTDGV